MTPLLATLSSIAVLAQDGVDAATPLTDACGPADGSTYVCRKVFEWTESEFWAKTADWAVARPLSVLFIVVLAWVVNRLVRRGINKFITHAKDAEFQQRVADIRKKTGVAMLDTGPVVSVRRAQRAEAVGAVMRSIGGAVIWGVAALMALAELGLNLGPLIAGAGIVGVALGFGAQSLVKDFLSGIFMLVEDQFGVGDIIDVGAAEGVVEGISLRATKVRDIYGVLWHVPNGEITRVGNKSQKWARALLDIEVAYETDLEKAMEVIKRVADEMWNDEAFHRTVILEEPEVWGVQTLGASGIAIRLVVKTRPLEQWNTERQLRQRIKQAFDTEGIEIPFPQRVVWMRQDGGTEIDDTP